MKNSIFGTKSLCAAAMQAGAMSLCTGLAAHAAEAPGRSADHGLYMGVRGGIAQLDDADTGDDVIRTDADFKTGYAVDLSGGYWHDSGFRGDLSLGLRRNKLDSLTITDDGGLGDAFGVGDLDGVVVPGLDARMRAFTVMANGYYELDVGWPVRPFAGAGAGFALLDLDAAFIGQPAVGDPIEVELVNDHDWVFAYQFTAGLHYQISDRLAFNVAYQYLGADDPTFRDVLGFDFSSEYSGHNIMAGFTFY